MGRAYERWTDRRGPSLKYFAAFDKCSKPRVCKKEKNKFKFSAQVRILEKETQQERSATTVIGFLCDTI